MTVSKQDEMPYMRSSQDVSCSSFVSWTSRSVVSTLRFFSLKRKFRVGVEAYGTAFIS